MKKNSRPTKGRIKPNYKLDGEDADLLAAIESGTVEVKGVRSHKKLSVVAKKAAANYFKKNARVSFRISQTDLDNVKRMAAGEGLPYQTFLTGIIHKLTTGQLSFR
jgi:predicted DNA binding CopG/RHH family protein